MQERDRAALVEEMVAKMRANLTEQHENSTVPGLWYDDSRDLIDGTIDMTALAEAALAVVEAAIREDEREACAKVADRGGLASGERIAQRIRARGERCSP